MNEELENEVEIETESNDDFEVEIVDDTPEEDRGRPRLSDDEMAQEPEVPDEELQNYSDNVKKRISQLTHRMHEERRRKEEAERLRDAAVEYAKKQHEENTKLSKNLIDGESVLIDQAKTRVESQIEQAKALYRNAYDSGDTDAILEAQNRLTTLQVERSKIADYKKREFVPPPEPQFTQTPQVQAPDQKAEEWAARNTWFRQDPEMTSYAFGVHERLVKSGYDTRSDEYYAEIDRSVRARFPENFGEAKQPANVVAPTNRSSKGSRKVKLNPSEVKLAKKLGITNEQFAAQKLKEMQR
tara:strand:+ start:5603 stop:6499 length:897 start_codon:yes stop_codon:yes gene_type:complete